MASPSIKDEIEKNLSDLPNEFTSDQIETMYENLVKDMELLKKAPGMNQKKMEIILQNKHKKMSFAYPGIFFKVMKGEFSPERFKKMLELKKAMDNDEINLSDARNRVVDGAKEEIRLNPIENRPKKVSKPGEIVQEINVKCKPDDF